MPKQIRQTVLPLVAALIWGTAFVMQKGNTAGALTFNASRSLIAFLFLLPVILVFTRGDFRQDRFQRKKNKGLEDFRE